MIVDSKPLLHVPPFRIKSIPSLKEFETCVAEVGLINPEGFALGAASGKSIEFNNFSVKG